MHIAILEDDSSLSALMSVWLDMAGHTSSVFESGTEFINNINKEHADLMIIDWQLPDITGDQVLSWTRNNIGWEVPIIFVTANDDKSSIITALQNGADDYMIKPVDRDEWLARINCSLRRSAKNANVPEKLDVGNISIDIGSHEVRVNDKEVSLTSKEFEVALVLLKNIGKLISREELLKNIWEYNVEINTRTVDTHVSRIRKKLELKPENGWRLSSVYNYGYRLESVPRLHS